MTTAECEETSSCPLFQAGEDNQNCNKKLRKIHTVSMNTLKQNVVIGLFRHAWPQFWAIDLLLHWVLVIFWPNF